MVNDNFLANLHSRTSNYSTSASSYILRAQQMPISHMASNSPQHRLSSDCRWWIPSSLG
uniref:Uncharacterized protein n=1 Tax=Rhizophora mucronata TaxID=61149 RepID=A0A2P2QZ14_RHIMU